jgi:tRNA(Ile2) C34 agmatinyltransferase TiaS
MSVIRCPGCGEQTFSIRGWEDVDRCPACGVKLATTDPRQIERRVRERLVRASARSSARRARPQM